MKRLPDIPNLVRYWPWLAAVLSGVLLTLCYAPFGWGNLVWIWSWPLLSALWFGVNRDDTLTLARTLRWGFFIGYLCGFVFFAFSCSWIYHTGKVVSMPIAGVGAVLGMGLYLGLYVGLFGAFAATAGRLELPSTNRKESGERKTGQGFSGLLNPAQAKDLFDQSGAVLKASILNGACWCGLEWLRSLAFTGFSWNSLGVALVDQLMLIQFADTIGQLGYGFVIMFCGIVGYATILRFYREIRSHQAMKPHLDFAAAIAMVIGLFLYGFDRVTERPEETVDLNVRIIQMNTSIEEKYSSDREVRRQIIWDYRDLTRAFLDHGDYDLVMWPETALPTVFSWPSTFEFFNTELLRGEDHYLLIGIEENDVEQRIFNTITIMQGEAESFQMYSKMHLVPFGEYVPGRQWKLPVFEWIFGGVITQDFTPGDAYNNLYMEKEGVKIAIIPLVCFEDTVARHARKFVRNEPQFIANVTNDAWFYDSAEPRQHFAAALFRCIELRRPMVRAANTGISGFIDETGNIFDRDSNESLPRKRIIHDEETGSTFIRGSINETLKVDLNPPMTIYAKIGDSFSIAMGLIALAWFVYWVLRARRACDR